MTVKYLTEEQVNKLTAAAKKTRNPVRNQLIIMMMYRHGLRVSELVDIKLDDLRLDQALFDVRRAKGSTNSTHPLDGDEIRLIRRYLKDRGNSELPWLFISERGQPFTRQAINYFLNSLEKQSGISTNPHAFRHGCGFYLANKGVDIRVIQQYLGHANIQNTVIYTALTGKQFVGLWK